MSYECVSRQPVGGSDKSATLTPCQSLLDLTLAWRAARWLFLRSPGETLSLPIFLRVLPSHTLTLTFSPLIHPSLYAMFSPASRSPSLTLIMHTPPSLAHQSTIIVRAPWFYERFTMTTVLSDWPKYNWDIIQTMTSQMGQIVGWCRQCLLDDTVS